MLYLSLRDDVVIFYPIWYTRVFSGNGSFYLWSADTGTKMGYGFRIFVLEDNDSLHPIPMARFNRLLNFEPDECFPEYAGQKKRCAIVVLEVEGKTPIDIDHIDYIKVAFDTKGRIDQSEFKRVSQLAVESFSLDLGDKQEGNIIDARREFSKRRYENEVRWRPTPKIEHAIGQAIFSDSPF